MAKLIHSQFTKYELTDQETIEGQILNTTQKLYLQTRLCMFAEEKNNLVLDPTKSHEFMQKSAELQGQIILLQSLLDDSDEAEKMLLDLQLQSHPQS